MKNFYEIIACDTKEHLIDHIDSMSFPCTIIVGHATVEAREEALQIAFGDYVDQEYPVNESDDLPHTT